MTQGADLEDTNNNRWPTILFFGATGFIFIFLVYYVALGASDPSFYWENTQSAAASNDKKETRVTPTATRLLLHRDKALVTPQYKIVYRGLANDQLKFDLYVLALDPHYAYGRTVPAGKQRDFFNLGDLKVKLLACKNTHVSLKILN